MKKVFFAVAALCAVLFCSCEKGENGGKGSIMFDGVNIVGTWACTASEDGWSKWLDKEEIGGFHDTESAYASFIGWANTYCKDGGKVDYLLVITDDYSMIGYAPTGEWFNKWYQGSWPYETGFTFKDGYLYDCTFDDFEADIEMKFKIKNGKLYISDILRGFITVDNDTIMIDETPWDWWPELYQRVKGYK